ncbi:MAG: DUF177 domain-containing protein [Rubrivivax sp.]
MKPSSTPAHAGRARDPRRLDVVRFAATGGALEGGLAAAELQRLTADASLPADGQVRWSARGVARRANAAVPETWLQLQAQADVLLTCQRCLQPLLERLAVDRTLRFVATEEEAERLDEEADDDVLAVPPRGLDLPALVEDELILALPLVPRHEVCPQPLPGAAGVVEGGSDNAAPATRRPFEALRSLRLPNPGDGEDSGGADE